MKLARSLTAVSRLLFAGAFLLSVAPAGAVETTATEAICTFSDNNSHPAGNAVATQTGLPNQTLADRPRAHEMRIAQASPPTRLSQRDKAARESILTQIRSAIPLLSSGNTEESYQRFLSALDAADKLDDPQFVIGQYYDVTHGLRQTGHDDLAEKLFVKARQSNAYTKSPPENADILLEYAILMSDHHRIQEAVPIYLEAIAFFNAYWGEGSEESLIANDKLAVALSTNGSAASATNLGHRNYELSLKALGPDHRTTWKLANNYADMLREIGAPAKAFELDRFAIEHRAKHYGENHLNTLVTVNNAGQDLLMLGHYEQARRYFRRHRAIATVLRPQDPSYAGQADAWLFYTDMIAAGDAPISQDNLERLEKITADEEHFADLLRIDTAVLAAEKREQRGERERGMRLRENALQIAEGGFTRQHPISFNVELGIAQAQIAIDPNAAAKSFAALDRDMFEWMKREVGTAGDRAVAEATRALADHLLFAYARFATNTSSAAAQPAFAASVNKWKSLGGADGTALRQLKAQLAGKDEQAVNLLRTALRLNSEKQELFSSGDLDDWSRSVWQRQDEAQKALDKRLAEIGVQLPTTPPRTSQLLSPDEAVVNYFITRKWKIDRQSAKPLEESVLYAIVETAEGEPRVINLGDPGKTIDTGTRTEIARLRSTNSTMLALDSTTLFQNLHERLVQPLEPLLNSKKTVYIVPDGFLFAVPFPLLHSRDGNLLEERYAIRTLISPDALIDIHQRETWDTNGVVVLAGGIEYGHGNERGPTPLPSTMTEINAIAKLTLEHGGAVEMVTGRDATERYLRGSMEKARIAHLATHGFYLNSEPSGLDALWQSGIVLSGAGDELQRRRDSQDGYLYAFEVMDWDLSRLDLLVLSACETGRGDESFVSGMRGLPTALSIAGARRALLTLWPVADKGTANFMVRFYEHLARGQTYSDALRQTRRDAREGKIADTASPSVWAAFVLFEG